MALAFKRHGGDGRSAEILANGLRWAVIGAVAVLILIPTFVLIGYGNYLSWYFYFSNKIAGIVGLNHYLIDAAVLILVAPLVYGLRCLRSLRRSRRRLGAAILIGMAVLYDVTLFGLTRNQNFAFRSGSALRWYAVTPRGVKYFDRPGVDPEFGIHLKPLTPEMADTLARLSGTRLAMVDPSLVAWFNPLNGEAELWYSTLPGGELRFFNAPGYDPDTGAELLPVTRQLRDLWSADAAAAKSKLEEEQAAAKSKLQREQAAASQAAADAEAQRERIASANAEAARETADTARANAESAENARLAAEAARRERLAEQQRAAEAAYTSAVPGWNQAAGRYQGAVNFWSQLRQQLATSGGSLRPEIISALSGARGQFSACQGIVVAHIGDLRGCTFELNKTLDKLDTFKN